MANRYGAAAVVLAGLATVSAQSSPQPFDPLRSVAEKYVKLVLAVGQHDADYVDAFYGPEDWRKEAAAVKLALPAIDEQAAALEKEIPAVAGAIRPTKADSELWMLRQQYLQRQLSSLRSRVAMLQGRKMTFDEESRALYDAVAPVKPESEFAAVLKLLDARLPGSGSLIERYDRYKQGFVIPTARVDRVFQEAIRGCRQRLSFVDMPDHERFTVEYVTGKSWSGYNWYQGD